MINASPFLVHSEYLITKMFNAYYFTLLNYLQKLNHKEIISFRKKYIDFNHPAIIGAFPIELSISF